jgi:2-polyprenyl-6-hydroxyphenyl methylase / 3-demethylubiquinone-9 3-methyltransferase
MPVDNTIYDKLADTWWDEEGFLNLLRTLVNPARFSYIHETLTVRLNRDPRTLRVLDIGCGGGLLTEEFARAGYDVSGIDPSEQSIAVAQRHALAGLAPAGNGSAPAGRAAYAVAQGERLPFAEDTFDAAYCCDVLEHLDDYDLVIEEAARVLKPDGVFFYDTFNRTRLSRLVMIKLFQEWRWSRIMMPRTHDWDMFITPRELRTNMAWHGFVEQDLIGLRPRRRAPMVLWNLLQKRRGKISFAELGRRLRLVPSRHLDIMYMGHAVKKA